MAIFAKKKSWLFYFSSATTICFVAFVLMGLFSYLSLPSIKNINDCFTTSMFQVELCPKNSNYVRFSALPKHLVAALIASEDASFYFHKGFDWDEIQDSLEKSLDAGRWVRGGSTLTQQLAKNLYLSKEKSLIRKMKEFFIAQEIEKSLSKSQIIEKYFNVVEFSKGIYGIRSAALHYFQKSPAALTPAEGAYLVSLLPNPIKYSSAFHSSRQLSRFNRTRIQRILSLLKHQGKLSDEEYQIEVSRAENGLWGFPPAGLAPETQQSNDGLESLPTEDHDTEAPLLEDEI